MVQWLGLHASTVRGMGSTPGEGTYSTCHAVQPKLKQTNKQNLWTNLG